MKLLWDNILTAAQQAIRMIAKMLQNHSVCTARTPGSNFSDILPNKLHAVEMLMRSSVNQQFTYWQRNIQIGPSLNEKLDDSYVTFLTSTVQCCGSSLESNSILYSLSSSHRFLPFFCGPGWLQL